MATGAKTGGRQKGTPNKLTVEVKAAILEAFDRAGGADYLLTVAKESPQVFCALLGKVLPLQIEASGSLTHYVAEIPATSPNAEVWQQQHKPLLQ